MPVIALMLQILKIVLIGAFFFMIIVRKNPYPQEMNGRNEWRKINNEVENSIFSRLKQPEYPNLHFNVPEENNYNICIEKESKNCNEKSVDKLVNYKKVSILEMIKKSFTDRTYQ
jgi:hypothetical protein